MVATNGWPLLADSLEGVRSVGAVKWFDIGEPRLRGTAALQACIDQPNCGAPEEWKAG